MLGQAGEIGEHGLLARLRRFRCAQSLVLCESRNGRRRQLGLLRETCRLGDRAAARPRFEREARAATGSRNEDRRLGEG